MVWLFARLKTEAATSSHCWLLLGRVLDTQAETATELLDPRENS